MPPSIGALNLDEVIKRDVNSSGQNSNPPDLLLLSPGPMIGCIIGGLLVLFLAFRVLRSLFLQIKPRIPRRRGAPSRLPIHRRMLQIIRNILPTFINSRLPDPTPSPVVPNHHPLDFPARSIDTLPPYPGFIPPDMGSPADSRRFLFLMPIMPIVHAVTRRPGSPALNPHGSVTAVGSAITIVAQPTEPPPPDYITLTPPYTANQEDSATINPADTQISRTGQEELGPGVHESPS